MDRAAAMRDRIIEEVSMMLRRPGMYTPHDASFEIMCLMRLEDLRLLDGRPVLTRDELGVGPKYGKCGVPGPFWNVFGKEHRYYSEVASVYAEIFHRYGYFTPDRLVPKGEWDALFRAANTAYTDGDVRTSEIVEAFGQPSLKIGTDVLCYAPENGIGWVFVDTFEEAPTVYEPGRGSYTGTYSGDPLVRDIRLPGEDFEAGLRLTLYGKVLRWGPGWWLHHGDGSLTPEQTAIAAQLRAIQAADPSQPDL